MICLPPAGMVCEAPDYTFRIDAPDAARVDVAVDGTEWRPGRFSGGYWYHKWRGCREGAHSVRAQAYAADGRILALESRQLIVRQGEDGQ